MKILTGLTRSLAGGLNELRDAFNHTGEPLTPDLYALDLLDLLPYRPDKTVLTEVLAERRAQMVTWGFDEAHDDNNEAMNWWNLLDRALRPLLMAAEDGGNTIPLEGLAAAPKAIERAEYLALRDVAALAIAAMESYRRDGYGATA